MGKRKSYRINEKMIIIAVYDYHISEKSPAEILKILQIPRSTLNSILEERYNIEKAFQTNYNLNKSRFRISEHPLVDRALVLWVNNVLDNPSQSIIINSLTLKFAAEKFQLILENEKNITECFIQRWRKRHNIKKYKISGNASSSNFEGCEEWKKLILPPLLEKYGARNIFNVDETGFNFIFFFLIII
jgi:hypothetical protein